MKAELLDRILEGLAGVRKEGAGHLLPEDLHVTFYVSLQAEVLTIRHVTRVERAGEMTVVESDAGDRYHLPTDLIAVVAERHTPDRGAGFR